VTKIVTGQKSLHEVFLASLPPSEVDLPPDLS
jgi:hypothetical protein